MIHLFNLGGFGQAKGYIISDFASGISEVESKKRKYMLVGNLETVRYFTYVKDACKAVKLIVEKGHVGEIYNISSGTTYKAQEILNKLINMAKIRVKIRQDPKKMRLSDTAIIFGNHDKLTTHTGWIPELNLDEIIKDALDYWRKQE